MYIFLNTVFVNITIMHVVLFQVMEHAINKKYLHTFIHPYIRICMHTYIQTYVRTHIYIHTYMHMCMHAYIHTYTYKHSYNIHTHTFKPTYTYIHTHIYTGHIHRTGFCEFTESIEVDTVQKREKQDRETDPAENIITSYQISK